MLSKKKHIPIICVNNKQLYLQQYAKLLFRSRGWTLKRHSSYSVVRHNDVELHLTHDKAGDLIWERPYWERSYLPPFSLQGKTVLDAGAGCGETAYLFFEHGASKVIAVESSAEDVRFLSDNIKTNGWDVEVVNAPFSLTHLQKSFDMMKMDIEGGEVALLSLDRIEFPCVIEVHSEETKNQFVSKFGMRVSHELRKHHIYTIDNFSR